jgi:hypothetical protein
MVSIEHAIDARHRRGVFLDAAEKRSGTAAADFMNRRNFFGWAKAAGPKSVKPGGE